MKTAFFLFILIIFSSCTSDKTQLKGNWYRCYNKGKYMEYYTKKDSFKIITNENLISNWIHYKIKSNTIYFTTAGEWRYPTRAFLNYHNKSLSMEFIERKEIIELKPLHLTLDNSLNKKQLLESVKLRAQKSECINQ